MADSVAETIVRKDETPFGDEFSEANLVYDTDGINIAGIDTAAGFMYMKLDEGEMVLMGAASQNIFGVPLSIVLDSSLTILSLPLEYGTIWSDSTFYLNIFEELLENPFPNPLFPDPFVDAKVEIGFVSEGEVDGWGTVMTPQGQFDVLRVKRNEVTRLKVSVFLGYGFQPVFDSTQTVIAYDWYAEDVGSVVTVTSLPGETDADFTEASRVRRLYRTNAISNGPPEIRSDSTTTAFEDRPFSYIARATDPDDDPLTYTFAHYPTWLTPSDSTITGTPIEGTEDTSFVVVATDGLLSDTLVVRVTVKAVNDPPVILSLPDTSFTSGDSVTLDLSTRVEDIDSPDSLLTWSAETSTEGLIITIGENLAVLTAPDYEGNAEVFFTVVDDSLASDSDTILVTVFEANKPPEILSDSTATALEDEYFSYTARAADPNGDSLSFSFGDYPGWMTPSDSAISGIPLEGTLDTSFVVIASDGVLGDSLLVRVRVVAVNDPPVILSLPDTSFVSGDTVVYDLTSSVVDVDSHDSLLTWTAVTSTEALIVSIEENRAFFTAPDYEGTADVIFTVVDDSLASDTDTILVTVFPPTGVSFDGEGCVPEEMLLLQNYPNPFNSMTSIQYALPIGERRTENGERAMPIHTSLKIYNILGQEMRSLVDESMEPGYYVVTWDGGDSDGSAVPSGVYVYVLKAGQYVQRKKCVLIK